MVVVVNPQSQNGQLGRRWTGLAADLRRAVGAFDDVLTRRAGDATELARQAIENGADMVVAIGGDGTINEVANGFFRDGAPINPDAVFGVLPYGTGGDFRKTVDLPKDIYEAGRILVDGKRKKVDVGRIDYTDNDGKPATRMFINIASFGISGLVDDYVNKTTKALGGKVSFLLATARAALEYQNRRVRLVFDGDEQNAVTRTVLSVAVANGRYFGGGMFIAPEAQLDDGEFDVVTLGDLTTADMAVHGLKLYQGTHLALDKVEHARVRTLRAEPVDNRPIRLDVDGETPGVLPAAFSVVPGALSLMVPR